MRSLICILSITYFSIHFAHAKRVKVRKVQQIDFSATDINGKVRNPDGAFMLQKKNIKFIPLHHIKRHFHQQLIESVHYPEVEE